MVAQRVRLIQHLRESGVLKTDRIADALLAVPRDAFLPSEHRGDAYADVAVTLKRDSNGSPLSSLSEPIIIAAMLELLEVRSGNRVLEIGAGSGYNAALLSVLAGPAGEVVSVEIERDLGEHARCILSEVGVDGVRIVIADGYQGYPPRAPYDRIVATTGASAIAPAWVEQLADEGRLVVPLVDQDGVGSIIAFEKIDNDLVQLAERPCVFLPMRRSPTRDVPG
jgi:protein-L-isoaspartate(D-aspartate) O-methyltransferase